MPTQLSVFNRALGLLGQPLVESVDDTGEDARVLRGHWEATVERCHEATGWDFAKMRAELGRASGTPAHGYDYYYTLPSDLLRLLTISETGEVGDDLLRYEIEQGKVATSVNTVHVTYISNTSINAVGRWSQTFADYVAAELAYIASAKLNSSRMEDIQREIKRTKSDAIGLDATQGPPQRRRHGTWSAAARGHFINSDREQR